MKALNTGFRFLLTDGHYPYLPSRCFIVANPKVKDPKAWTLELDRPEGAVWVHELDDVKSWMLHGVQPKRQIFFDPKDPMTAFRELECTEVFRRYVLKVLERLPNEYREGRKLVLMPSLTDETTRKRYRDALEAVIPGGLIVPEPEMVAEYFRLIQRTLELAKGENNVILVVDVGASTANMSFVISRRDEKIFSADVRGSERDLRVRALRGNSAQNAGRWVDDQLIKELGVPEALLVDRQHVQRAVEAAKVRSSQTGQPTMVELPSPNRPLVIDRKMLVSTSESLWLELAPIFSSLCVRLYENQTSSPDAKKKSQARFVERNVSGHNDAHRLVDAIVLAGGTSLLPGFEEAMLEILFDRDHRPKVLRVGGAFPIAAAAGGLAHMLQNYEPSRLHASGGDGEEPSEGPNQDVEAVFEASLPFPLELGIKDGSEVEQKTVVLDPDDPFIDDGGRRPIEGTPSLRAGSRPKMRLVPGGDTDVSARIGRPFYPVQVLEAPGRMELEWDPAKRRALIHSEQISGTAAGLWLNADQLRRKEEPTDQRPVGEVPPDALIVDGATDVVLDLGMSKLVAVAAAPGWVSAAWLERVVRYGLNLEGEDDQEGENEQPEGHEPEPEHAEPHLQATHRDEDLIRPAAASLTSSVETTSAEASVGFTEAHDAFNENSPDDAQDVDEDSTDVAISPGETVNDKSDTNKREALGKQAQDNDMSWRVRASDAAFRDALLSLRDATLQQQIDVKVENLVLALLALAVRPVVLIAGPPGCGKSTLVRVIAHVLGKRPGHTFHEVAVQAHWVDDGPLFAKGTGSLRDPLTSNDHSHLILFDEVNLTRPEYFLTRFFYAIEHGERLLESDLRLAPCRAFGTLNIDDTSRPPSPKVIDKCFLIELPQVAWDDAQPSNIGDINNLPGLPGLPDPDGGGEGADARLDDVLAALHHAVDKHQLRHDLLPSRRVLSDTRAVLRLHSRLDLEAMGLLRRDDLVDHILSSRVLVKLSGAFEQVKEALDAVEKAVKGRVELKRTHRRIELARLQSKLGYVSPWQ